MTVLNHYNQFDGRHWETGSVANHMASRGFSAPHSGKPYSEALLLGVSGGIVMGYFTFFYKGHPPQARILTRNTFAPMDRMLARLGVVQERKQTVSAERATKYLCNTLADGVAPIVWADIFNLPYCNPKADSPYPTMLPLVVYGYDAENGVAHVADRAAVGLTVSTEILNKARSRVAKYKNRLLILNAPNPEKLASAVQMGIHDCIRLFTEAPPKGSRHNFGLLAYKRLADELLKPKLKKSWAKNFPAGGALYAGLTGMVNDIAHFGTDGQADRGLYADFLDEAALILTRPALTEIAEMMRDCGKLWQRLTLQLLPDKVPPLSETRMLMQKRHDLFHQLGNAGAEGMMKVDTQLDELKRMVAASGDGHDLLSTAAVAALHADIAAAILAIRDAEAAAIEALRRAIT